MLLATRKRAVALLAGCLLLAACAQPAPSQPAPTSHASAEPTGVTHKGRFDGSVGELLRRADEYMGSRLTVTGEVGQAAEGGPLFTLIDRTTGSGVLVLLDTRTTNWQFSIDWLPGKPQVVVGRLYALTAANIDRIGDSRLRGADVLGAFQGPTYLVIATSTHRDRR